MTAQTMNAAYTSTGRPRYRLLVAALLAIYTYAFVDRVILALLVEPIRHDLGASDIDMGLMLGLGFALFYAALSVPAGFFVDRYSRRLLIGIASVLWALMTIVCGTADALPQLFLGRAGVGIAESIVMPAAFSLIRDAVPQRSRGFAFSIFAMAPVIGSTMSLIGGGALLRAAIDGRFAHWPLLHGLAPWQCTLIVIGALGLPLGLLLLPVREPVRSTDIGLESQAPDGFAQGFGLAIRFIKAKRSIYIPLMLFSTFASMSTFSANSWLPAMLGRSWHLTPQVVGPMLGSILLPCGLVGLTLSGFILNWLSRSGGDIRNYGIVAALGTAIGLVGAATAHSLDVALAMSGVGGFFWGTAYAVGASTLGQVTPVRLMGRITAIYFLVQTLFGQTIGPLLVALGSQYLFAGPDALARSMTLNCTGFGVATIAAAVVLRNRLRGSDIPG